MSKKPLRANMAQLAVLRGKQRAQDLEAWVQYFGKGDVKRAERYLEVVRSYFGGAGPATPEGEWRSYVGGKSPATKKAYLLAITEFFEWISRLKGRVVAPEDVSRADASEYVQWLSNPRYGFDAEKVKDGDRELDRRVVEFIEKSGGEASFEVLAPTIAAWLGKDAKSIELMMVRDPTVFPDYGVSARAEYRKVLGRLVKQQVLKCTPSVNSMRKERVVDRGKVTYPYARLGITLWVKDGVPFDFLFTYSLTGEKMTKRSTAALKISALSSFWEALSQGENRAGGEPILQHNIWKEHVKTLSSRLRQEKKDSAATRLLTTEEMGQLFTAPATNLVGLRDKAIIYLLAFTGIRSNELLQLKRGTPSKPEKTAGWFEGGEVPRIFVTRKRGRREYIPYPHIALHHLMVFQKALADMSVPEGAQWEDPRQPGYFRSEDPRWLYQALGLPSAPLFPMLGTWGNNKNIAGRVRHLTRSGLFVSLRRVARKIGFTEQQIKRIHPHAFRHFFATTARAGGMPIHEIQARLGVTSLATLEVYFDAPPEAQTRTAESAVLRGMGDAFQVPPPVTTEAPIKTPPVQPPAQQPEPTFKKAVGAEEVIETVGEAVPETSPMEEEPARVRPHEGFSFFSEGSHQTPANRRAEAPEVPPVQPADGKMVRVDEHARQAIAAERSQVSLGSPEYSYEGLKTPGRGELISFTSRKDTGPGINLSFPPDKPKYQGNQFLLDYYDPWPPNYGVGQRSLLPWFFTGGAPDRHGFFAGNAPLPVWSRDQLCPDTQVGEQFLVEIEAMYLRFLTGDESQGKAPNPAQAYGLLRWFGFFVYSGHRLSQFFEKQDARPVQELEGKTLNPIVSWHPWNADIPITKGEKNLREHDDKWLLDWLQRNSHTYKTSLREYRNVARQESGDQWILATLEGVNLTDTKLPAWFASDDPLALPEGEWEEFVRWLSNITGKRFTVARQEGRMQAAVLAASKQQDKRAQLEKSLRLFFEADAAFYQAGSIRDSFAQDEASQTMRSALAAYIGAGFGFGKLSKEHQGLLFSERVKMDKFIREFRDIAKQAGMPNPFDKDWEKHPRIENRIVALVNLVCPQVNEEDVLLSGNVVADSELFEQLDFDPSARKVGVKAEYRDSFIEKFGQDPELLLRRALRGMWEAAKEEAGKKGKDIQAAARTTETRERSYNVMLSYLAWIVPSGQEMEKRAVAQAEDVGSSLFRRLSPELRRKLGAKSYEQLTPEDRSMLRLSWIQQYQENLENIAKGERYWREKSDYWLEAEQEPDVEGPWGGRVGMLRSSRRVGATPNPPSRLSDLGVAASVYDLLLVASIEGSTDSVRKSEFGGGKPAGIVLRKNGAYQDYVYSEKDEDGSKWHSTTTPNGGRKVLVSEAAVEQILDSVYVPTMLLPSPFRQIIATTLL